MLYNIDGGDCSSDQSADLRNIPWLETPFAERSISESAHIDEDQKSLARRFSDDGYIVLDPPVDDFDVLLDRIINDVATRYGDPTAGVLFHEVRIQDAWQFCDAVKQLAVLPRVLSLLRMLYRREPVPFQTLNFRVGTQQRTHSDATFFHSAPARFMCGVWVALEDIDEQNGPLHYYPARHKLPVLTPLEIGFPGSVKTDVGGGRHIAKYNDVVDELVKLAGLERSVLRLRKGQILIWSANLLHGGSPILTPGRTRHSQVTHYYFSGCRLYQPMTSDPFLNRIRWRQVRDIATGEIVPHTYCDRPVSELARSCFWTDLRQNRVMRHVIPAIRKVFPKRSTQAKSTN